MTVRQNFSCRITASVLLFSPTFCWTACPSETLTTFRYSIPMTNALFTTRKFKPFVTSAIQSSTTCSIHLIHCLFNTRTSFFFLTLVACFYTSTPFSIPFKIISTTVTVRQNFSCRITASVLLFSPTFCWTACPSETLTTFRYSIPMTIATELTTLRF